MHASTLQTYNHCWTNVIREPFNVHYSPAAATVFREKWKDAVKQADSIQGQVATMEKACSKEKAVQVCCRFHLMRLASHPTTSVALLAMRCFWLSTAHYVVQLRHQCI